MGSHSQRHGRRSGNPDPDPGNPDFPDFFFAFLASMDLLEPQGHPPDGPESPNLDPYLGNCGSSGNRRVASLVSAHVSNLKSRRSMLEQRRYKQLLT